MKLALLALLLSSAFISVGANLCRPNPCQHGGRCKVKGGKFSCTCVGPWEGSTCRMPGRPAGPCDSNPCKNGGECFEKFPDGYFCDCNPGYLGANCQKSTRPVNNCRPNPCKNSGRCESSAEGYKCYCNMGYTGVNCQTKVNPCRKNPCLHGGKCTQMPKEGYTCSCVGGYEGKNCAKRRAVFPGGATEYCLKIKSKQAKQPAGNPSWMDNFMSNLIADIKPIWKNYPGFTRAEYGAEAQIMGKGSVQGTITAKIWIDSTDHVKDLIQHYVKSSKPKSRFMGIPTVCGTKPGPSPGPRNPCRPNPCKNGGICSGSGGGAYKCKCMAGYGGVNCQTKANPCRPSPCGIGGECKPRVGGYICVCKSGYGGENCKTVLPPNPCRPNPCQHGGRCVRKGAGYVCNCKGGYGGSTCRLPPRLPGPCDKNPCKNGGRCISPDGKGYICDCKNDYTGKNCQTAPKVINHCRSNPCRNGAGCIPKPGGYVCLCKAGYGGENCQIDRETCQEYNAKMAGMMDAMLFDCNDDGTYKRKQCYGFVNHCYCVDPITGKEIDGTRMRSMDFNLDCWKKVPRVFPEGTCGYVRREKRKENMKDGEMLIGAYIPACDLDGNYELQQCSSSSGYCWCVERISGDIIDGTQAGPGLFAVDCASLQPRRNYCRPNPCRNGGECISKVGGYVCICKGGYGGEDCQTGPNYCRANPCRNGGECRPKVGGYVCICKGGYGGENCNVAPNRCRPNPCGNRGECIPKVGGYVCICKGGYGGENCNVAPNRCRPNPCGNGGECIPKVGGYVCICKGGYGGENCDVAPNRCRSNPCGNGGECRPKVGGYVCICKTGYGGENCNRRMGQETVAKYCLQIKSADAKGSFDDPNFFKNFVDELKRDLTLIWKSYSGFMRAEFGVNAQTKPNGKVQATIRVTVWVSLSGYDRGVTVKDLINHFVQSNARKNNFIGTPQACT